MAAVTATAVNNGTVARTPSGDKVNVVKSIFIGTDDTADATDTISFNLANFGGSTLLGVMGFKETTNGSVVVTENATTSVSGTTVTLTVPAGTDNDRRNYVVFFE